MEDHDTLHTGRILRRSPVIPRITAGFSCIGGAFFLIYRMFVFDQYPTALSAVLPTLLCTFEAILLLVIGITFALRNQSGEGSGPA